jgi:integrase/recombinase XerD
MCLYVEEPRSFSNHMTTITSTNSISYELRQYDDDPLFDRKMENVTLGLKPECYKYLQRISRNNAITIAHYIISMQTEINPSDRYRRDIILFLCKFSQNNNDKPFNQIRREDVVAFLDSFRRPESSDALHKWIGTYNLYRIYLMRFFKWLYYPDIEPDKRPKSEVIENIPQLKRKEQSVYKPSDLWTTEDDLLFLKYCPSKRIKCYHTMSRDTSCRPHELLKLKIKDIVFKTTGNRQYAEILVNGKRGTRHVPLIDSLPYVKDYLDHEHPQPGNSNAVFLCGMRKSIGRVIGVYAIEWIYRDYKTNLFPKLLESPNVQSEDKQKIKELLKKPWNPYIRRHSALTEKSTILKEHVLRQHAGWSARSQMHLKYLHYFGNESSESLLEAYGIVTKDQQTSDSLKPKQCPNCNEPNKPDSKFCAKCRMVLTYDAYNQTVEEKQQKESEVKELKEKYEQDMKLMQEELKEEMKKQIAGLITKLKPEIIKEGLL